MVDTLRSGRRGSNPVEVRLLSRPPILFRSIFLSFVFDRGFFFVITSTGVNALGRERAAVKEDKN